jgi:hypothetical protein
MKKTSLLLIAAAISILIIILFWRPISAYIYAVFWFVVITCVVTFYLYSCLYIFRCIAFLIRKILRREKIELSNSTKLQLFFKKHTFLAFLLTAFIFNSMFFIQSNIRYFNNYGAYSKAKALFFVGNTANTYSKIFSAYMGAPDMWYLAPLHQPLVWIKQAMYAQTVSYLPKDEPERDLLRYNWFHYPYVMRFYKHKGFRFTTKDDWKLGNQVFIDMLEDLWQIMESINTKEFADNNREIDFILSMPTIGTYYFAYNNELLSEKERKDENLVLSNKTIMDREEQLFKWINVDFDIKSRNNERAFDAIAKNLNIYANKMELSLYLMEYRISVLIYKREFSCEHPLIKEYAEFRNMYFTDNSVFGIMWDKGQQELVRRHMWSSRDNMQAEYTRQLLAEYCLIDVAGISQDFYPDPFFVAQGRYLKGFHNNLTSKELGGRYREEMQIIEDELNITKKKELDREQLLR